MKFKLPAWVQYTDEVLGGDSKFFRIRINSKYVDDPGIIAHEYEHVRHWYVTTGVSFVISLIVMAFVSLDYVTSGYMVALLLGYSALVYNSLTMLSKKVRFKVESMCYAKQLSKYPPENYDYYLGHFEKFLAENYELDITRAQARKAIEKEL